MNLLYDPYQDLKFENNISYEIFSGLKRVKFNFYLQKQYLQRNFMRKLGYYYYLIHNTKYYFLFNSK